MKNLLHALLFSALLLSGFAQSETLKPEVPVNAKKPTIIALAPHIVEMLYDIGAGDQIIGTTDFADYPEQAKAIPRIGNYAKLQIEKVIALQPDIILAWQSGNPSDDLARLKQLGFNITYSEPKTFEDIADEIRLFGKLSDNAQQAQTLANEFLIRLAKIKKNNENKEPITVFYELWSRPLTTIAKNSWPQQHLSICRAHNPFEQVATPYPQVNIEQVLQFPIELIIQPISEHQKAKEGFNWQDWSIIPAVKNQRIIYPNADALHRMTPRSLHGLDKLCQSIDQARLSLTQPNTK